MFSSNLPTKQSTDERQPKSTVPLTDSRSWGGRMTPMTGAPQGGIRRPAGLAHKRSPAKAR